MSIELNIPELDTVARKVRRRLLAARTADGHWVGQLSSSALSTATATFALHLVDADANAVQVRAGLAWLAGHQNADGGWGDTVASVSNLSTTALAWAALSIASDSPDFSAANALAEKYIALQAGSLEPACVADAIAARYGGDKTFSVPILSMLALAGRLGPGEQAWRYVQQLPFEFAACPRRLLGMLRLPVVSYALPALIAIGQARHRHKPTACPLTRTLRNALRNRTLRMLRAAQPASGGFLEAAPLTSFVMMNLRGAGIDLQAADAVIRAGVDFLLATVRPDGSWPIDTNLATWVTTLSINALAVGGDSATALPQEQLSTLVDWLLALQGQAGHPYTMAAPGGWAWTDSSGGVPDGDDTPGAMLALHSLAPRDGRAIRAAAAGAKWLMGLQNRDGGTPAFCRGWGRLPFDRSSADLTAHSLSALRIWLSDLPTDIARLATKSIARGLQFLRDNQRADGAFLPLWFGNQHSPDESNPTYGTARVLMALADFVTAADECKKNSPDRFVPDMVRSATRWLLANQNTDGGWGGQLGTPSSVEETALSVDALAKLALLAGRTGGDMRLDRDATLHAIGRGARWLIGATGGGTEFPAAPIGLYFAKLWYSEELYPLIFTASAMLRISTTAANSESACRRETENLKFKIADSTISL